MVYAVNWIRMLMLKNKGHLLSLKLSQHVPPSHKISTALDKRIEIV